MPDPDIDRELALARHDVMWTFYDLMVATKKLRERHEDALVRQHFEDALASLDKASARVEQIEAPDA